MKRKLNEKYPSFSSSHAMVASILPVFFVILVLSIGFWGSRYVHHVPRVLGTSVMVSQTGNAQLYSSEDAGTASIPTTAIIDCIGPDEKHIQVTFKVCSDLNTAWHNGHFTFTQLETKNATPLAGEHPVVENSDASMEIPEIGDVAVEDIDTTGTLSATDLIPPHAEKKLTVVPGQIVTTLIKDHVFDSIESEVASHAASIPKLSLTQLHNQPVMEISGVTNKKLFGLFPVSFAKTAFVNAQSGSIITINQTFLSSLLEKLSF